jgi:hypothetical protein
MSDRLTLAAKARALIAETDPNAVRDGLREIAEALEATGKMARTPMHDIYEAADRPFVDALPEKLFLAAIEKNRFDTILPAVLEMLCWCITEVWLSPAENVAEGWHVATPDRTVVARDLGNELPDMVERWAQEHGRAGWSGTLEPDARGWVILKRDFPEWFDDDSDT